MRKLSQIKNKVKSFKAQLKRKPIVENFGDTQIRKLDDFIGDIYGYNYFDRLDIVAIQTNFFDWCINFAGKEV